MPTIQFGKSAHLPLPTVLRIASAVLLGVALLFSLALLASEDSPFVKPDCDTLPKGQITAVHAYLHLRSCEEKKTLAAIWRTPKAKTALLRGLAAAESDWIDVSFLLLPHANRSQSKTIVRALQEALAIDPEPVLSRASREAPVLKEVCGYPRGLTYDLASSSLTERMSAVETWLSEQSKQPGTTAVRAAEECAAILQQAEEQLQREFGQQ